MKSKAVIFAGGSISGLDQIDLLENININELYTICVDKGADYAIKNKIKINVAIGDFDSASKDSINYLKDNNIKILTFNKDKDMTDLELSLEYCLKNNINEIYMFGATGSRIDHSLSNIFLLKTYSLKGLKISIIDKNNYIFYLNHSKNIKNIDRIISILPTNENCIFSLYGAKWPLENHKLKYGSSLTVSNEFVKDIKIDIRLGDMFVILSRD